MPSALTTGWHNVRRTWDGLPGWLRPLAWTALALLVLVAPNPFTGATRLDDSWMRLFFFVGLYAVLGLGINTVVGMAGLLDLGYVAFFAAGAYTVAILGSDVSPHVQGTLPYWYLLPLGIGVAALLGILLGLPVLPLRGDYLAIVTLGFGEIIRICAVNMNDWTNGSSGLFELNKPELAGISPLGGDQVDNVREFYVMVVLAALLVWFVTSRLRDSRVGRAWEAIREDEDAAAAMGINTTRYKLMAFAVGAACGGLGGAIFAPFLDFVSPQSFGLIVSINVLAVVIIGGMGSTQGVFLGSLILLGIPELLQFEETGDFLGNFEWLRDGVNGLLNAVNLDIGRLPPANKWGDQLALYRFMVYGLLLVLVMVLRPAGLLPSRRRSLEFAEEPEA